MSAKHEKERHISRQSTNEPDIHSDNEESGQSRSRVPLVKEDGAHLADKDPARVPKGSVDKNHSSYTSQSSDADHSMHLNNGSHGGGSHGDGSHGGGSHGGGSHGDGTHGDGHHHEEDHGGHDDQGDEHHPHGDGHHHHGNFKEIFLRSLPLGLAIMILSPLMGIRLPFQFTFQYSDILAALAATVLLIYGGKPFYQGALHEFKARDPGMMALVSLGISVSYLYSIYAVIARYLLGEYIMDFFFEFASLILIMLLGHWIEMRAVGDAGDAQKSLAELIPKDAQVEREDGSIEIRPVSSLQIGDIVRIQAGENIPADGTVVMGESRVNEAIFTGESKPVEKKVADFVIGGSTNGPSQLKVRVEETGDKSFIAQVRTLISQAASQSSRAENMADKVAAWLFYIAVGVALLAFILWLIIADLETAVRYTVTTLVIACPHALGLAIPLVVARSTSLGASRGLLVKNRDVLEYATKADVMILDKTGTLTSGEFRVLAVDPVGSTHSEEEITGLLAGIETGSSHPIAQSIVSYAEGKEIQPIPFDSVHVVSGEGVEGIAQGKRYELLSQKAYGKPLEVAVPQGSTVSILVEEGEAIGTVALGDELKCTSRDLVSELKSFGIKPLMATGDNELAAKEAADALGIEYLAGQSPQDKYALAEKLKTENKTVIMVGDGVNDAPSLTLADVGIAIGAGTQVALDSADVILTQSDPADIVSFLELSKKTMRKMKENLIWGAGYNFLAIPVAAGVLAPIGITISPAVGAILMSLSTVIVSINAMRLKLDD